VFSSYTPPDQARFLYANPSRGKKKARFSRYHTQQKLKAQFFYRAFGIKSRKEVTGVMAKSWFLGKNLPSVGARRAAPHNFNLPCTTFLKRLDKNLSGRIGNTQEESVVMLITAAVKEEWPMLIQGAVKTDIGKVRSQNEDAFGFFPESALYVVADGMGGLVGGHTASTLAVETMLRSLQETQDEDLTPLTLEGRISVGGRRLFLAVQQANSRVFEAGRENPRLNGMGTTIAAVFFDNRERLASICHVGDSRVYRVRDGNIEQLTEDHSLVQQLFREGKINRQELKISPHRNVLTQAVGVQPMVSPTLRVEEPRPEDIFIICSDGMHGVVEPEEILQVVRREGTDLQTMCDTLVNLANDRGGRDNSTVLILRYHLTETNTNLG
jgi:protein phosphatase